MICEWHIFEPRRRHVFIERSPAAIVALETKQPIDRPAEKAVERLSILRPNETKPHEHHGGVVHVWIINVVVLESPAARLPMRIVHGPVAANPHFLLDQPIGRLLQRWMLRRQTRLGQGDHIDGSVPNRREARLNPKIVRVVDKQTGKILRRLHVNRVRFRITERTQSDETIEHGGIYGRESVTPLANSLEHPTLRFLECALANRTKL